MRRSTVSWICCRSRAIRSDGRTGVGLQRQLRIRAHEGNSNGFPRSCNGAACGDRPYRGFAADRARSDRTDGPVLVYNASFESARMKETAMAFPDLATALHAAIDRIVDLLPIARDPIGRTDRCWFTTPASNPRA